MTVRITLGLIIISFISCSKKIGPIDGNSINLPCEEADNSKNDLTKQNLRGSVASYKSSVHQAFLKSGKIEQKPQLKTNAVHETYKYNDLGYVDEVLGNYMYDKMFGIDDKVMKTKYLYDDKSRNIEAAVYQMENGNPKFIRKSQNIYDSNDELTEIINFQGSLVTGKTTRKVNKENNSATEFSYDASGTLIGTIALKYDDRGNEVERVGSKPQMKANNIEQKTYDSRNNQIAYSYDGEIGKFDCVYKYDDKNNMVDKICGSSRNTRHNHFDYVYDSHCNWIQRIEIINDMPDNITIRIFQYHANSVLK